MKKIFLLLTGLTCIYADLSVKQIENMVYKIHEQREGIKLSTLMNTKEPFVRFQNENNISTFVIPNATIDEDAKLTLHAIVNGKVYINNDWMDINESILGYKLMYIGKKGVVLRNENNIKKLFLSKTSKNSCIKLEER